MKCHLPHFPSFLHIIKSNNVKFKCIYYFHFKDVCVADQCRNLEFGPEKAFEGKRLINHIVRTVEMTVSRFCENLCYMEPDCVSIYLYTRGDGNYKCELKMLLMKDTKKS